MSGLCLSGLPPGTPITISPLQGGQQAMQTGVQTSQPTISYRLPTSSSGQVVSLQGALQGAYPGKSFSHILAVKVAIALAVG